ncbi:Crossover junction endonuclease mus81 [Cladophialophora chaetospira]|uniref:Crossover junction endonuclease MUS81 n=1 Tax=Cladophialophora chaetospira TaxID=386627 RepID=A0AA39CJC4_9EURO|nr:Crossover junction endonuclease mus81 [Cladophialophora chaetospira]
MAETCKNPLLAGWLKEWMDQAKERSAKSYTVYKKAYTSMIACPTVLKHPSEAQILNGIGPKLCDKLTDKLREYSDEHGIPMPKKNSRSKKRVSEAIASDAAERAAAELSSPARKKRKAQPYVPKYRSGAYGLIVALGTLDRGSNQAIPKLDLIALAQEHCDSSYTVPSDTTKFFTAWKSMQTLESKELVCTKGHPTKRYYLSDDGWEVADGIQANAEGRPTKKAKQQKKKDTSQPSGTISRSITPELVTRKKTAPIRPVTISRSVTPELVSRQLQRTRPATIPLQKASNVLDLVSDNEHENDWPDSEPEVVYSNVKGGRTDRRPTSSSSTIEDTIILPAGSFEVKIVLDTREIRSVSDRDYISAELKKHGVTPILRTLPLGDVLWVAEVNPLYAHSLKAANVGDETDDKVEIVLEHILERKRLDDLISSIKDGRFHEQKFRLHKSGIKSVTYLVEEHTVSQERMDKYGDAVESAIASMQVVDNFFVKQTTKLDDTISYLARMTKTLKSIYETRDINVLPSQSFEAEAVSIMLERFRKISPNRIFGMMFSVFGAMCDKSESMTLRDVYLKMLMCIRGVTGEKAVEIQKNWATPRALAEAYEGRDKGAARDSMISDRLGNAIPRKKVAKALSAKIAEIWA